MKREIGNRILLPGCRSSPLANYLKALGVLRLIAGQRDTAIRAGWANDVFYVCTALEQGEIVEFFCDHYRPTPLAAPWNGGSGFYPNDRKEALEKIRSTDDPRFQPYKDVLCMIDQWPYFGRPQTIGALKEEVRKKAEALGNNKKGKKFRECLEEIAHPPPSIVLKDTCSLEKLYEENNTKQDPGDRRTFREWWGGVKKSINLLMKDRRETGKEKIFAECRSSLPDDSLDWIDSIGAMSDEEKPRFAPVAGSGGNDGRLELSNTFMQNITALLLEYSPERRASLLQSALFEKPQEGLVPGKIGLYHPGRAGGANQGMGVEQDEYPINPWDFVFLMEGLPVLAAAVHRRSPGNPSYLSSPFTVRHTQAGYTSAAEEEGVRESEVWMPLWPNPARLGEVRRIFAEGRSLVGRRPRPSRTGLDFARSVSRLGVDRGIAGFERYAFLVRRGKSRVALPLGRVPVQYHPGSELLDELDPVLSQLDRSLRGSVSIPVTIASARRTVDEAFYACALSPSSANFLFLVRALGRLLQFIAREKQDNGTPKLNLFRRLSPRWVLSVGGRRPEVRIAAAIASIGATGSVDSVRAYLVEESHFSWQPTGVYPVERLISLLFRRQLDAGRSGVFRFPLEAGVALAAEDVMPFLRGGADDRLIEELLYGFLCVNWHSNGLRDIYRAWKNPLFYEPVSRSWCLLKLLHTPGLMQEMGCTMEPRIIPLLQARRVEEALEVAGRRLLVSGFPPWYQGRWFFTGGEDPLRLAASLLVPVKDMRRHRSLVLREVET